MPEKLIESQLFSPSRAIVDMTVVVSDSYLLYIIG